MSRAVLLAENEVTQLCVGAARIPDAAPCKVTTPQIGAVLLADQFPVWKWTALGEANAARVTGNWRTIHMRGAALPRFVVRRGLVGRDGRRGAVARPCRVLARAWTDASAWSKIFQLPQDALDRDLALNLRCRGRSYQFDVSLQRREQRQAHCVGGHDVLTGRRQLCGVNEQRSSVLVGAPVVRRPRAFCHAEMVAEPYVTACAWTPSTA